MPLSSLSGTLDLGHWADGAWIEGSWVQESWGSDSPTPSADDVQASNWRIRKDRRFSVENWREWIEEEAPEVVAAVQAVVVAEKKIAAAVNTDRDITAELEAARLAREAYREAYKQAFQEAELAERLREDIARYKFEINRRAALLLLLAN